MKSPVKLKIFNCKAKMSDLAILSLNIRSSAKTDVLTFYIQTSVCIFSILFS